MARRTEVKYICKQGIVVDVSRCRKKAVFGIRLVGFNEPSEAASGSRGCMIGSRQPRPNCPACICWGKALAISLVLVNETSMRQNRIGHAA